MFLLGHLCTWMREEDVLLLYPEVLVQPYHAKLQCSLSPRVLLQPLDMKLYVNHSAEVVHLADVSNDKRGKQMKKCSGKVKNLMHMSQKQDIIPSADTSAKLSTEPSSLVKANSTSFSCIKCNKSYSNRSRLNDHMKIHIFPYAFTCENCSKSFPRKTDLKKHKQIHYNDPKLICSFCGKKFIRMNGLNRHEMVHRGEKPHACKECNKTFSRLHLLQGHKDRIHSFLTCHVCRQEVPRYLFKSHKLSHLKIKLFSCKICGMNFRKEESLQRLGATHSEGRPYMCGSCGKYYETEEKLKEHESQHLKSFICDICDKGFATQHTMERHKRTIHS